MLEHVSCPKCHAPNLASEFVCFACGASLRAFPKRFRGAPAVVPWPLWIGMVGIVLVLGLVIWHAADWLAGIRQQALFPAWYLAAGGAALLAAAQVAFFQARFSDRRWWGLKRAPEVSIAQSHTGDVVWVRGKVECDTPLICPYLGQPCAYYRVVVKEREPDQPGWKTISRQINAVDFRLVEETGSVYVPTGGVLFDAPQYLDGFHDASDTQQVLVWALPVGMPASLFGLVGGDVGQRRMDGPGGELPAVATWRLPQDYVAAVGRRAKLARAAGWVVSVLGMVLVIAALTRG